MKLDEILNKPLDFKVTERSKATYIAEFTAGGRKIQFVAYNEELDYGDSADEGEWVIEFSEAQAGGTGAHGKTGSGKEFDVFATLKAIIQDFIGRYDPKVIAFSADKDKKNNRSRVYAKLFQKNIPAGWHLEKDETPVAHEPVFFKLVREALDSALPYEVTNISPKFFDAKFKAGDRWIEFTAQLWPKGNYWEIIFEERLEKVTTTKATGSGNEFQVFATVKAIISQFIKECDPKEILVGSSKSEPARARLYQRMIAKNIPSGWKVRRSDAHPSYTSFSLIKEGAMKRSDPYISGEKAGPRPPDLRLAPAPTTAHKTKIEGLMKKSGKTRAQVEAAWNRAAREVPDGIAKWSKVMKRAKADLGVGE